jgi:hypothetical protein
MALCHRIEKIGSCLVATDASEPIDPKVNTAWSPLFVENDKLPASLLAV